jgi:hypothetical protein
MKLFTQIIPSFTRSASDVSEAARSAGYAYGPVLHGGNAKPDGTFPAGKLHFFSDSVHVAAEFASYGDGTMISVYLKIDNPITYDLSSMSQEERESYYADVPDFDPKFAKPQDVQSAISWIDATGRADYLRSHSEYDGMIVLDGASENVYIVRESWQIKSADPVTYDGKKNPIPTSKRFDSSNPDIRY